MMKVPPNPHPRLFGKRDSLPRAEHLRMIREACRSIQRSQHPPSLSELAAGAELSPFYFQRIFLLWVGITPKEYAVAWQRERLVVALTGGMQVLPAIYAAGYRSTSRVYGRLEHLLGMTPAQLRKGAHDVRILYTLTPYRGGWLAVAATQRGICAVEIGSSPAELVGLLAARFPRADLVEGSTAMAVAVALLTNGVSPPPGVGLPREIRMVALRQRMWRLLDRVPLASITYSEVDRMLPQLKRITVGVDNSPSPVRGGPVAKA